MGFFRNFCLKKLTILKAMVNLRDTVLVLQTLSNRCLNIGWSFVYINTMACFRSGVLVHGSLCLLDEGLVPFLE